MPKKLSDPVSTTISNTAKAIKKATTKVPSSKTKSPSPGTSPNVTTLPTNRSARRTADPPSGTTFSGTEYPVTTSIPQFRAGDYISSDVFVPGNCPYIDEATYSQRLERIRGQQRAAEVATENLKLNRQLLKAEGVAIDGAIEVVNNQIKAQDLRTAGVKYEAAKVKTGIEQQKLNILQHDLNGYTQEAQIKGEAWQLKIEGLQHDLTVARHLLAEKRASFSSQFATQPALPRAS